MAKTRTIPLVLAFMLALAASHLFAYLLGQYSERRRTAPFHDEFLQDGEASRLRVRTQALRIFADHPDRFTPAELDAWCAQTETLADEIDPKAHKYRQEGKVLQASGLEKIIAEARRLVASVRREK